jgi:riboflavin-specific deaminase-like protein
MDRSHSLRWHYLLLISLVAALGGLLFGYDWVVIGGAKPFFEKHFDLRSDALSGWANSCALVGCLLGAIVSGALTDRFGRKRLLILAGVLFLATGIGTALADDCLMTDRTGLPRSRPLLRIVADSQLRLPVTARLVAGCQNDVLVVTTSAASPERYRALEDRGVRILTLDGHGGRTNLPRLVEHLAREKYLSLMVEAGSKLNWAMLESGVADKIFFYYAPKILGGLNSLPVVGGIGRKRRADAILFRDVKLHRITEDEFAVEAWLAKGN